jgi:hypothetical protein
MVVVGSFQQIQKRRQRDLFLQVCWSLYQGRYEVVVARLAESWSWLYACDSSWWLQDWRNLGLGFTLAIPSTGRFFLCPHQEGHISWAPGVTKETRGEGDGVFSIDGRVKEEALMDWRTNVSVVESWTFLEKKEESNKVPLVQDEIFWRRQVGFLWSISSISTNNSLLQLSLLA